ncbi:RWD domain-containing protein 4-like [Ornithodoros turicata]|uniref:RWD domain-containing protein 4-like n=1 Tax=Ornithodoros turicata TaxID=34597 RepID=UPI00313A0679
MSSEELQQEEVEVLQSIYDGDENFKQISSTVFQYKVGDAEGQKSFLLEISWPEKYPNVRPQFNVDTFYNKHLTLEVKQAISVALSEQAELELGTPMTYTLFEWAKENAEQLMEKQPEQSQAPIEPCTEEMLPETSPKKQPKQPKLSKSQKRKLAGRVLPTGELPRGYDWVDVVKHLSQTGSASAT